MWRMAIVSWPSSVVTTAGRLVIVSVERSPTLGTLMIGADMNEPKAMERCEAALDDLFAFVVGIGGVISGEHGIGLAKKRWWPLAASKEVRQLHRTCMRGPNRQCDL